MNRDELIDLLSEKIKIVRAESGYTQEKMAEVLGISKKTLVGIEKGRFLANWTTIVAFVSLFSHSPFIQSILGDDPIGILQAVGHNYLSTPKQKTLGGYVWWKEIKKDGNLRIQQNLISNHYRILDENDYRWFSSFEYESTLDRFKELTKEIAIFPEK